MLGLPRWARISELFVSCYRNTTQTKVASVKNGIYWIIYLKISGFFLISDMAESRGLRMSCFSLSLILWLSCSLALALTLHVLTPHSSEH